MRIDRILTGIAVAALVAASGTAWAQSSATASANASATVVTPITLASDGTELNFGSFEGGLTGGTVVVDQAGAGSVTGDVTVVPAGTSTSAAGFDVGGEANAGFDITGDTSVTLADGGNTMTATLDKPTAGTLDASGAATFAVGGELTVAAGQAAGAYTGSFNITATYQ